MPQPDPEPSRPPLARLSAERACFILAAAVLVAGCGPDRGACLQSHTVKRTVPAHTRLMPAGKVLIPIYEPERTYTETVCDQWQCPTGEWRDAVNGQRVCVLGGGGGGQPQTPGDGQ